MFQRLENDYETAESKNMVGKVLTALYVSRRGLTESELLDMLHLQHGHWSPLYLAINESIVSKSGFLTFFHDHMKQAVYTRYGASESQMRDILLAHFNTCPDRQRHLEEVPYQLEKGSKFSALCDYITDLDNFTALYDGAFKFDLYRYWRMVDSQLACMCYCFTYFS